MFISVLFQIICFVMFVFKAVSKRTEKSVMANIKYLLYFSKFTDSALAFSKSRL